MRGISLARFTLGLVSLQLFAGFAGEALAQQPSSAVVRRGAYAVVQEEGVFDSFDKALRAPEKVRRLAMQNEEPGLKHLRPGLGTLVNLEALELSCLEQLEDLPEEIGRLRKLEELIIDNGNGCSMNVRLPRSIGELSSLRVLRLYGALDPREVGAEGPVRRTQNRALPDTLANLQSLEELDLGRNGISSVPRQVAQLRGLKKLSLDYNDIHDLPAFVGDLPNLRELSLNANGGMRLPQSLANLKGLKVYMGNNRLKLAEQKSLRARFPSAVFSFENEYDDDAANQEAPKPRTRRRR